MSRLKINRDGTFTDDAQTHTFVADQTFNYDGSLVTNIEVSGTGEWIVVAQPWGVSAKFNTNAANEALEASQTPQDVKIAALETELNKIKTRAEPVVVGDTYAEPKLLQLVIPAQGVPNAADPFLDINNDSADYDKEVLTVVPAGWSQAGTVLTNAEFAQTNMAEAAAADKSAKGVAANFDPTDADYEVGKPWDAKTLVDRFGRLPIVQPGHLGAVVLDTDSHYWADETPGAVPVPSATTVGHEYVITNSPANETDTDAVKLAAKGKSSHFRIIELSAGNYGAEETDSSEEHTHKALKNIAVHVRSAGTNAGSSVAIELLIDGAWNPTDWVVSTTPVTGLESYTAHGPVHKDRVAITGPIGIGHNKDGWLFFEYIGDAAEGELTGINYTGANGANSDGEIIVNLAGTNQAVTFANKAAVVATDLEFQQAAETTPAKNALVYPVGNFTALPVNDSGTGSDGAVYKLPTIDALQITLPNKADMNATEGIYRVRVSGDWAALSTQATVLSFIDDTANGVDMGTGLPDDGNEWLDLVFDAANDKWIATSGGDVTLTQVIPTYDEHAEVPANIRLYLVSGTGAASEGLWRKETAGDAPNMIG